jgi:multiple sugar transport system substrate-binding protein
MTFERPFPALRIRLIGATVCAIAALSCGPGGAPGGRAGRVSLLVAASERPIWEPIARSFEAGHPGVAVELVEGPNDTDRRESLYTAALLARDDSFDLVSMDVTWTSKFAAAGWLVPLDDGFPGEVTERLLPQDVEAGRYRGALYRIPVRTDVGLLYERRDLLDAAGIAPPETFADLERAARALQDPPRRWGFLWQASQYEGLSCDFLEVLRGYGGFWIDPETLAVGLDRVEALRALEFLRSCVRGPDPISPPGVTTYKEEESRRLFQDGRAVFLRNWPYVWRLAALGGSAAAGRIAVSTMVHAPGAASAGTLGGWGFGVSRYSHRPDLAIAFIRHAVTLESQRALCRDTGYAPALIAAYGDPELLRRNPFLSRLYAIHRHAVARPAIPRYALASDILQRHVSAALSGLETPAAALAAAAAQTRLMLARSGGAR